MPIRIPAIIEISDEDLGTLRAHLQPSQEAVPAVPPALSPQGAGAVASMPSNWTLVEELHGVEYTWGSPDGNDVYDPFKVYEGAIGSETYRLAIGSCTRTQVRGRDRKYLITHLIGPAGGKRAVAEFLEVDDADQTHEMIAIIKGKDESAKLYDPTDELPAFYSDRRVEVYRERIVYPRSYNKLALIVNETDGNAMLDHTLFQIRSRGLDRE